MSELGLTLWLRALNSDENHLADKFTLRIVTFDLWSIYTNGAPKIAYLFDGKENQPVSLPSMNFSPVVGLPSGDITILMTPDDT